MPGSRASVFGEAEDFQAALSADRVAGLLVTGRGQFRARLTQVRLDGWRLAAVEEALSRIAFVAVPAGMVLVSFSIDGGPSPVWGGIEVRTGEILTLGPDQRVHAKTLGSAHWGAIQVPDQQLARYGRALNGARFVVPPVARWRPPPAVVRQLRNLHRAAIRMAEARAGALTDLQAAHGLEQQLLQALIECLADGAEEEKATGRRHRRHLWGARRVAALAALVLQRAFRYGPEHIPVPLRNATGAPRPAARKFGRDEGLRSRRAIRLPWSRPFRHPLSCVIRRITVGHFAASLKSGRGRTRSWAAARKIFVTALTWFNRSATLAALQHIASKTLWRGPDAIERCANLFGPRRLRCIDPRRDRRDDGRGARGFQRQIDPHSAASAMDAAVLRESTACCRSGHQKRAGLHLVPPAARARFASGWCGDRTFCCLKARPKPRVLSALVGTDQSWHDVAAGRGYCVIRRGIGRDRPDNAA